MHAFIHTTFFYMFGYYCFTGYMEELGLHRTETCDFLIFSKYGRESSPFMKQVLPQVIIYRSR